MAAFPKGVRLERGFVTRLSFCRQTPTVPRHPLCNAGRLCSHSRFRLTRVRSPLLAGSLLFSLPPGTEMFQFSGCPLPALWIQAGVACIARRVSPFGCLRVIGRLRLTGASRRLLRPSSAPCPKASTVRPCLLDSHQTFDHIEGVPTRLRRGCPRHVPVKLFCFSRYSSLCSCQRASPDARRPGFADPCR